MAVSGIIVRRTRVHENDVDLPYRRIGAPVKIPSLNVKSVLGA